MDKRKEWFLLLQDMGCICCLNTMGVKSDPDIHHILHAGKRIDDFHTIPLCPSHHRLGVNNEIVVSRHPWKKEFEKRYGTEMELLEQVRKLADELRGNRVSGKT
jgi:hypothetical protein